MRPNAWHWVAENRSLRDGRPLPEIGETLRHEGEMRICRSGLHASRDPLSALQYAPGPIICRVRCNGIQQEQEDKFVCRERTILWTYDATQVLLHFARLCALDVVHLWDAPTVVLRYLRTGDEALRQASKAASWEAGREESQEVSWAAIWAATAAISASCANWATSWDASRASWESSAASRASRESREASWEASRAAQARRLTRMLTEGAR